MSISKGDILEGKVTGTTAFGAFVSLKDGQSGLVHISEISDEFVEKVEDYLNRGDDVRVKVISIDDGKIGLSIKQAQSPKSKKSRQEKKEPIKSQTAPEPIEANFERKKPDSFEDMLQSYLKDANTNMESIRSRDGKRGAGQRYRSN